uniref:Uncharacterized protein n=1 Tax=Panagrolaimus davidi TaxID=227884 RepID=A0A914Q4M4_9BILA
MIYEFSRNGVTKKLNEKSATPANLSKLFKVSLDSLMLINAGGDLIIVEGTEFCQSLEDGAVYQVDGDEISTSVTTADAANANSHQVTAKPNMHLISTHEQFLEVKSSISKSTQPMHDNICLLYDGPNAVSVVNSLAILAAATDDPSVISNNMSRDQFKYMKNPGSFRASLYQVSTSMCNAFRKADNSMGTIYAYLVDLPEDIQDALIEMVRSNSPNKLNRLVRNIAKSSEGCMNSAKEAKDTLNSVLGELQELILGAISAQSTSEENRKAALKQLEEFKIKQKQQNEEIANRESQYQENAKLVQEALENYKKASVPVDVVDLMGLTVVDMVKDSISGIIEAITEWIDRLEVIKGSARIADVVSKVKDLRIHLQSLLKNPELLKADKKVALMSKEISKLVQAARQHIDSKNQQSVEREKACLSFAETRVKEHSKALNNARDRLDKEEERKDKNMEGMLQSKRELADLMANMKNLDLTKVEMNSVISCLQEGLTYLSKVEKHWENMTEFFETMNRIISVNLKKRIEDFTYGVKDADAFEALVKPALLASGMCVQICNCASIYQAVSQKFVMPEITNVAENLSLSKEDARAKKDMIELESGSTHEKVRQLIDAKMKALMDAFEDNLEKQQTQLFRTIAQ